MGPAVMLAAMLMAQLPAAAQVVPPSADPARWRCTYSAEGERGALDVVRSLDADGRIVYDYVIWSPSPRRGTRSVRWERVNPLGSTALPWTLRSDFAGGIMNLARPARRPVWLVMRVDGRAALRRLLFRDMSELHDYDREQLEIWPNFRGDPPEPGRLPDAVPDLTDATEAVLTAEEEGGETLASFAISLPGRALLDRAVARAAPVLDEAAADYRRRCRAVGQPPAMEPMPPPR